MPPSTTERSLIGTIGAHTQHAIHDPRKTTALARAAGPAGDQYWLDQVPDDVTDPDERERRARHLKKAHFARLALLSARARRGAS